MIDKEELKSMKPSVREVYYAVKKEELESLLDMYWHMLTKGELYMLNNLSKMNTTFLMETEKTFGREALQYLFTNAFYEHWCIKYEATVKLFLSQDWNLLTDSRVDIVARWLSEHPTYDSAYEWVDIERQQEHKQSRFFRKPITITETVREKVSRLKDPINPEEEKSKYEAQGLHWIEAE